VKGSPTWLIIHVRLWQRVWRFLNLFLQPSMCLSYLHNSHWTCGMPSAILTSLKWYCLIPLGTWPALIVCTRTGASSLITWISFQLARRLSTSVSFYNRLAPLTFADRSPFWNSCVLRLGKK
jgi:hypothetical protein